MGVIHVTEAASLSHPSRLKVEAMRKVREAMYSVRLFCKDDLCQLRNGQKLMHGDFFGLCALGTQ